LRSDPAMNVLFLFPDQWRWDWIGTSGSDVPVQTPNLDRLAARGTQFDHCCTNSPVCAPARACLVQGLRYDRAGVPGNGTNTDPGRPNYLKQLRAGGYEVSGSGKFDLFKPERHRGLDGWTERLGEIGFTSARNQSGKLDCTRHGWPEAADLYSAHLHEQGLMEAHVADYKARAQYEPGPGNFTATWPTPLPNEHYTDDFCGRMAEQLLRGFERDKPWHLWVNFPGPHNPLDPTADRLAAFEGVDFPAPVEGQAGIDHQACRRAYAACCLGIDEWVGRLIDVVEQRGEMDRTLIIFASDHGEMLGDHGRWGKSVAYEPSVHVPLILAGPGVPEGERRGQLVELIDLAATITEAAGASPAAGWDARSLWPVVRDGGAAHRDVQVSGLAPWRSISDGRYKLVVTGGKGEPLHGLKECEALYDLKEDPWERRDLAGEAAYAARLRSLRERLAAEIGEARG